DAPEPRHGRDQVLDGHGARRAVEGLGREGQVRIAIQVVDDEAGELRVVRHLLRVHAKPHYLGERYGVGEMAPPAAHHVEDAAAPGEHLRVELPEGRDGAVVDMHYLARKAVELLVGRLVVPGEGGGREYGQLRARWRRHSRSFTRPHVSWRQ